MNWTMNATFRRAVKARRDRLGLGQEDVARLGGPSSRTLRSIENPHGGSSDQIGVNTLMKLDKALAWDLGTAENVIKGKLSALQAAEARIVREVEDVDSREWKAARPQRPETGTMSGVAGLPSAVDNVAFALRTGMELIADAIRYHGDQQVEAAKNRRTRGE